MDYPALFERHQRVALQISGGKDSLAVLHLMGAWLDRVCVYWLNPGNPLPETIEIMKSIRNQVPQFVEVPGRQKEIIAQDGWPSDVVPVLWTSAGHFMTGAKDFKVHGRFDCCWRALMLPLHERMVADGVTCIIRGKRAEEDDKSPSRSGDVIEGIEFIYPLWDWSENDVLTYLNRAGIKIPEYYAYAGHSLDCMDCTAWFGEGLPKYLAAKHPEQYAEHMRRIALIKQAVVGQMAHCED